MEKALYHELSQKDKLSLRVRILEQNPAYPKSIILGQLRSALNSDSPPFMDVDDVDGSLTYKGELGEEQASVDAKKARVAMANDELREYTYSSRTPLLFLTGRSAVEEAATVEVDGKKVARVDTFPENFPKPVVFAGSLGAERFVRQEDGLYVPDLVHKAKLQEEIGYKRNELYPECVDFLHAAQQKGHKLAFQERDSERNVDAYNNGQPTWSDSSGVHKTKTPQEFKISYHLDATYAEATSIVDDLRQVINGPGKQRKIQVILSHHKTLSGEITRYNIDVLPQTKEQAIADFERDFGCLARTAGDSGNDTGMILNSGIMGIVVGGAKKELTDAVKDLEVVDGVDLGLLTLVKKPDNPEETRLLYIERGDRVATQSILAAIKEFNARKKQITQLLAA